MKLPAEYINYIQSGGELEFETDFEFGGYIILEPLNDIEQFNTDIEIKKYAPGFIAFGSDGGGEVFVFNEGGAIYMMPMIGMSPKDAVKIADSWSAYENKKLKTT